MPHGFSGKPNSSVFYNQGGVLIGYTSASNKNTNSISIAYPTGSLKNNILIFWGARTSGVPAPASPWVLISSAQNVNNTSGYTRAYYRIITETSLTGNVTMPFSAGIMINLKYYRLYSASSISTINDSTLTLNPVFGDYSILLYGSRTNSAYTPPTQTLELVDYNPGTSQNYSFGACKANSSAAKIITRSKNTNEFFGMCIGLT